MYMTPIDFIDLGFRTFMRNPFSRPEQISLRKGESDFRLLGAREGLVVTLGPETSFFDRPSRSVCRWPGTRTIPRQSPHFVPKRSWLVNEFATFLYVCFGGGDVKLNRIATSEKQREILLTAGEGNVVEKIDLTKLAGDNSSPLLFLQPAYLCSSSNVAIESVPCDASTMSWARAPYVYRTCPVDDSSTPAILCLAGKTMIWCERIEPGESSRLRSGKRHCDDRQCRFQTAANQPSASRGSRGRHIKTGSLSCECNRFGVRKGEPRQLVPHATS